MDSHPTHHNNIMPVKRKAVYVCVERTNNCLLHRMAEGTWPCKEDHINAHPKGNWSRLARKKTDLQIVHGSPIPFTFSSEYLTKEGLEGSGDLKIAQVIRTVKYSQCELLALLAKEERVPQDMTDGLTEIERCYRMEMNVEKARVMRISLQPRTDYERSKTTGKCGLYQLFG